MTRLASSPANMPHDHQTGFVFYEGGGGEPVTRRDSAAPTASNSGVSTEHCQLSLWGGGGGGGR